jgi:site-specific DNA-methyltransferase (adenine-specific)
MKPYYEHGGITIYHGDCRDVLPSLGPADAIVTDPPYGVGFSRYASHDDDPGAYGAWIWPTIEQAERLIPKGWACVFQSEANAQKWAAWFPRDWRLMALPKTFGQVSREPVQRQTDYVLYWACGETPWPPVGPKAPAFFRNWFVSRQASNTANRPDHPCPRPLDMMQYLVGCFVPPGGSLVEPFAGSGTTLLAAKNLGRRAIGIEIEERYCEIAAKRLSQEVFPLGGAA